MAMILSDAQRRVLAQVATRPAIRIWRSRYAADYVWRINDDCVSGPLDRLYGKRLVTIEGDRASITPLGRQVLDTPPGSRR